ncbi:WecB/TagA/CpsF family glycosyltransferase [Rheinheimera texasensis]|uniref:WecB/TagA/CpsF family glycosyltransferase n=1 Tax=Rheinheimera texasensis TaxID=306205 RepID=UPI0032B2DF5F
MIITNFKGMSEVGGQLVSFVNPYSYYMLRHNLDKYSNISFLSDGFIFCLVSRLFGLGVRRYSFDLTSIAPEVFASSRGLKIAVVGSTETNVQKFRGIVKSNYNCEIYLAVSGFLSGNSEFELIENIVREKCDLVIVGLGTPKQEDFLLRLKMSGYLGTAFTCGGFITQTAEADGEYYPHLINKYNLRFLYRMIKEPHTIKRYFCIYPISIIAFFFDLLQGRVSFDNKE